VGESIQTLILRTFPSSALSIKQSLEGQRLLGSYLYHSRMTSEILQTAWLCATTLWDEYSYRDMIDHRAINSLTFTQQIYYSIEYSYILILSLLKFQLHTPDNIESFIIILEKWMNRETVKKNTIAIYGPANSGKTWFADTILNLVWNVGHAKNPNRYNQFPWDNCFSRRMISWNECKVGADRIDEVKRLLEGDPIAADIKYETSSMLRRTPVLITSNHRVDQLVPGERQTMEARMYSYVWQQCEWLKQCSFKPHPLLWKYLINFRASLNDFDNLPDYELLIDSTDCIIIGNTLIKKF